MDNFQEQVFIVGNLDNDIDLNSPPATGEEYIKRVILEARKCQDVVVVPLDVNKSKQSEAHQSAVTTNDTPDYIVSSQDWQDIQIKDFTDVRLYITELRNKKQLMSEMRNKNSIELPDIDDEKSWINMCSGVHDNLKYLPPKLNIILSLNQPTTERILEHLITHIKHEKIITHNIGRWVYALLASLELPLNPDTCSSLRFLAICCNKIRINLNSIETSNINIYNLFICLVAKYFRQLDLADQ